MPAFQANPQKLTMAASMAADSVKLNKLQDQLTDEKNGACKVACIVTVMGLPETVPQLLL
jgi:hypothetical protein